MLGEKVSMPIALAPTGLMGLVHGDGEMLAARAAEAAGIRFCQSTMSICTIEDVRSAVTRPFWFQLYVFRDRGFSEIDHRAGARGELLGAVRDRRSADARPAPRRPQERAHGAAAADRAQRLDIATKPGWALGRAARPAQDLRQCRGLSHRPRRHDRAPAPGSNRNFDRSLNWRDIDWLRGLWPGKLVLKGILDVEDAKTPPPPGVDAIVVSNHGGRQLDGARSSIAALPEIASAVGDRLEVLFDGGIRSGLDVLKALGRGAHGCLIGRAYLYGLAANGEAGVRQALDILRAELEVGMTLDRHPRRARRSRATWSL